MSEAKWTKGPWLYEDTPDKRTHKWIRTEDRIAICEVNTTGRSWDAFRANRSLIAAAPDLYEALAFIADNIKDPALIAMADAALNKAKGED